MIKKFEAYLIPKKKKGWLIPISYIDKFGGALVNIGMPDDEIVFWTSKKRWGHISNHKRIMLFLDDEGVWTWSPSTSLGEETDYQGIIIPSEDDMKEWELKRIINKYNI
jgi:hypothetical protein